MKILLVDDELSIERVVRPVVVDAGYEFAYAEDGITALRAVEKERPDLIIMDVMLPRSDGFTVCRRLREQGVTVPVIFLSAKGDIVDKGVGFAAGGDDYMTKPFDPRELLMHIEAHLRRMNMATTMPTEAKTVRIGRLTIDRRQHRVTMDGTPVALTPKEFGVLALLAENAGQTLTKQQIIEQVWGREFVGETTSITVFIKKLRAKVEDDPSDPQVIQTVWGIGYRLEPDAC